MSIEVVVFFTEINCTHNLMRTAYTYSNSSLINWYSKNVMRRLYYDYYFHRQENLWRQNALKTLPVLLNSSDMLSCGEDLGLIPSCVHPVSGFL